MDILVKLREQRERRSAESFGKDEAKGEDEDNFDAAKYSAPLPGLPPGRSGQIVILQSDKGVVLRGFAGAGPSAVNSVMTDAQIKLRKGRFYAAARAFRAFWQSIRKPSRLSLKTSGWA